MCPASTVVPEGAPASAPGAHQPTVVGGSGTTRAPSGAVEVGTTGALTCRSGSETATGTVPATATAFGRSAAASATGIVVEVGTTPTSADPSGTTASSAPVAMQAAPAPAAVHIA